MYIFHLLQFPLLILLSTEHGVSLSLKFRLFDKPLEKLKFLRLSVHFKEIESHTVALDTGQSFACLVRHSAASLLLFLQVDLFEGCVK